MKTKIADLMKKHTVLCVILALSVLFVTTGIVTYAEFTKSTRARRVIYTGSSEILFSSNFLQIGDAIHNVVSVYTSSINEDASAVITICNYAQSNPDRANDRTIPYELSVKFVTVATGVEADAEQSDLDANQTVTLSLNDGDDVVLSRSELDHTFPGLSLTAGDPDFDTLSVTFDKSLTDNSSGIMLEITATPNDSTGLSAISGIFSPTVATSYVHQTWAGRFTDDSSKPTAAPSIWMT